MRTTMTATAALLLACATLPACAGCDRDKNTAPEAGPAREDAGGDAPAGGAAPVDAQVRTGGLSVTVEVPGVIDSCGADTGITADVLTLVGLTGVGQSCAPVTFVRVGPDGTITGDYLVNCSSPQVAPCIQRGEVWSVPIMAPGSYAVHVVGKVNASDCWRNDDALGVSAGRTTTAVLLMRHVDGEPGCAVPPK